MPYRPLSFGSRGLNLDLGFAAKPLSQLNKGFILYKRRGQYAETLMFMPVRQLSPEPLPWPWYGSLSFFTEKQS